MVLKISELAGAAGVNVPTVRYYERRGMIPAPRRTRAGYRQYDAGVVDRIRFIKRAQRLGFTLDEIAELLLLRVDEPTACPAVEESARAKLTDVESRIRELERLRGVLGRLVRSCQDRRRTAPCPILAVLEEGEAP